MKEASNIFAPRIIEILIERHAVAVVPARSSRFLKTRSRIASSKFVRSEQDHSSEDELTFITYSPIHTRLKSFTNGGKCPLA
jgi:hypothetical protein